MILSCTGGGGGGDNDKASRPLMCEAVETENLKFLPEPEAPGIVFEMDGRGDCKMEISTKNKMGQLVR